MCFMLLICVIVSSEYIFAVIYYVNAKRNWEFFLALL